MNISDLSKDMRYNISIFLCPKDLISFCCCNKNISKMLHDDQFWYHKLLYDFPLYTIPPSNINFKTWYYLVYIMINVADCYYLDELGQEMFKNNKYKECSILLMASCFREHVHIQDCLYKFNKYIYDISVTSLPLTPKEFM